jgi:hypothetical protein
MREGVEDSGFLFSTIVIIPCFWDGVALVGCGVSQREARGRSVCLMDVTETRWHRQLIYSLIITLIL